MSKRQLRSYILALILIIAGMQAAFADDFSAYSNAQINVCPCSTAASSIRVTNTQSAVQHSTTFEVTNNRTDQLQQLVTIPTSFTVSVDGEAADWIAYTQNAFILDNGESTDLQGFITAPCGASGDYDLVTRISSQYGLEKSMVQNVRVDSCVNVYVTKKIPAKSSVCPCTPVEFEFTVRNTGTFTETYYLSADQFEQYIAFSSNSVILLPGEEQAVFMYVSTPCEIYGKHDISLKVETANTRLLATTDFVLDILPCYDYELVAGSPIDDIENSTGIEFMPYAGTYEMCEYETRTIPILVKNLAAIDNTYSLSVTGPQWSQISVPQISLIGGNSTYVILTLDPGADIGQFDVNITAVSKRGDVREVLALRANANNCRIPSITLEAEENGKVLIDYNESLLPISIRNTGKYDADYSLMMESEEWVTLMAEQISLEPNETIDVDIHLLPGEDIIQGEYDLSLVAVSVENGIEYASKTVLRLRADGRTGYDMLHDYRYHAMSLASLVILLAVMLILISVKKKKDDADEHSDYVQKDVIRVDHKAKKAAKLRAEKQAEGVVAPDKPKSRLLLHTGIALIIIGLIGCLLLYSYYADSATGPLLPDNDTAWDIAQVPGNLSVDMNYSVQAAAMPPEDNISLENVLAYGAEEPVRKTGVLYIAITYIWYILGGLLVLLLLIYWSRQSRARKHRRIQKRLAELRQSPDKESPEGTGRKAGKNFLILFAVLILLLLMLAGGYYMYQQRDMMNIFAGMYDEASVQEAVNETTEQLVELPDYCTITWDEDTEKVLDLSRIFSDPDGDELAFNVSSSANISVDIEGGVATLVPARDFAGAVNVEFYADDLRGGAIGSGNLTLCIRDLPEPQGFKLMALRVWEFLKDYYKNIIAGCILALIATVIFRKRKVFIRMLEDDDAKKEITEEIRNNAMRKAPKKPRAKKETKGTDSPKPF